MSDTFIIDESYDLDKSSEYSLSIQVALDGFSFVINDTQRNKLIVFGNKEVSPTLPERDFLDAVQDFFNEQVFFQERYPSTKIILSLPKFTTIPCVFFNTEQLVNYYDLNVDRGEFEELNYNKLNSEIYTVFSMHSDLSSIFINSLSNYKFIHSSGLLINKALQKCKNSKDSQIFIEVRKTYFFVAICSYGELVLANSYRFYSLNDFIYFVMNVYEQMKLNPAETVLHLTGNIDKTSNMYFILKRYIKYIEVQESIDLGSVSAGFNEIDIHKFLLLFNEALCE